MDKKKRLLLATPLAVVGIVLHFLNFQPELITTGLCVAAWLLAGFDVLLQAVANLRGGFLLGEHFLMSVATVGALLIGEAPEAAMVMVLYQLGETIQERAVNRSRRSITELLDIAAPVAYRLEDGERMAVDPEEIAVGDLLELRAGDKVPVDGTVVSGTSAVDSSALTGESVPVPVEPGDTLLSGSINGTGHLVMRAEKEADDSTAMRILTLIEEASEHKAKSEALITRFSKVYTPIVVLCAALLAIIPPLTFSAEPFSDWLMRGLTFLVVSCPCAFVISVPMAFFSGIGVSSRMGALVKGGNVIEALAKVDTLGVDKTGTITEGKFEVLHCHPETDVDASWLLALTVAMESGSTHPIAEALRRHAEGKTLPPLSEMSGESEREGSTTLEDSTVLQGRGVRARLGEHIYAVGNYALMEDLGLSKYATADGCEKTLIATMAHVAQIAPQKRYLGHFVIRDRIKSDAKETVTQLHRMGVTTISMLTGDGEAIAREVAAEVGIDEVHARLLPQEKLEWVEEKKRCSTGAVAFVGDGLNDAPVLTAADVGLAMGGIGSDASIEAADVVLLSDDLSAMVRARSVAQKTMQIARQNIFGSLGVKFIFLVLSAIGLTNMWMAVFADVGVTLLAVANCFRIFAMARGTKQTN